jgi:hypothetical protein
MKGNLFSNYNPSKPHCFLVQSREDNAFLKLLGYSSILVQTFDIEVLSKLQGKKVVVAESLSTTGFDFAEKIIDSLGILAAQGRNKGEIQSLHILKMENESLGSLYKVEALKSFLTNLNNYECIYTSDKEIKPPIKEEAQKPQSISVIEKPIEVQKELSSFEKLENAFERMKSNIPQVQKLADFLGLVVEEYVLD